MAIVNLTDRPKLVRNRCVIEVFGSIFVLSHCLFDFSDGVGAFVIDRTESDRFLFLFSNNMKFSFHDC